MGEVEWERARLFPVSGIGGADEQERRASSALLAVIQSVQEFGRAITAPMGAPAGRLSTFIEVPFDDGDKKLRPDGLIQVVSGHRTWTALVEIKTGRHDLIPGQIESYMDVARRHKFDALLTISNQVVAVPGVHPVQAPQSPEPRQQSCITCPGARSALRHWLSRRIGQSATQTRHGYLPNLSATWTPPIGCDRFPTTWGRPGRTYVTAPAPRRCMRTTRRPQRSPTSSGDSISFAALQLSRELRAGVRPMVPQAQLRDPARYLQEAGR